MPVSMVEVSDTGFCVDTYGDAGDPAVLLMGGATSSMDWWGARALRAHRCGRSVRDPLRQP